MTKREIVQSGKSAVANLETIGALAAESLSGREACYRRNAVDCARWMRAVALAHLPLPAFIERDRAYFRAIWGV